MGSEDAIFGRQVFIAQQQFLVDEARHKGQKVCPMESIMHGRTFIINDRYIRRRHPSAIASTEYFDQTGQPGHGGGIHGEGRFVSPGKAAVVV